MVNWLENRNLNITQELSHTCPEYFDSAQYRRIAQIREEIEKVKPSLAFTFH